MDGRTNLTSSPARETAVGLLNRLRFLVRSYVLVEGTALVVAILGIAFWLSFALDRWLELAVGWRVILLVAALATAGGFLISLVLQRFFQDFTLRALAMVLERRYPQLDERLITTVELVDELETKRSPLTESLLARTADELGGLLNSLKMGDVFNLRPLIRAIAVAALLLLSIGAFTAVASDSASLWFRRNVLMKNEFWPRQTDLVVKVLADPGERVIPFTLKDGTFRYKHPQGQNLTLVVDVPEGKVVPDQVQMIYTLQGGGGGTESLARVGDRSFRYTLSGLQNTARLWFYGGDYSSRTPLTVEVVSPPQISRLRLECNYPAYTEKPPEILPVSGTQISLPAATQFILRADANKPLQGFRLACDLFALEVTRKGAILREPPEGPEVPLGSSAGFLPSNSGTFSVPMVLMTRPADQLVGLRGPRVPLRLPPSTQLSLTLHDADDVISAEPTRLTITSVSDEAPVVKTELRGIGSHITRQATVPVSGTVTDDYGVIAPRFDYRLDTQTAWEPRGFAVRPAAGRETRFEERFDVLPLDLKIGQKLTLTVSSGDAFEPLPVLELNPLSIAALPLSIFAQDVDDLTGPHRAQGDRFTFEVVTNEELLAQIASRELNLRQRFEQIIAEVKETRKDLQLQRAKAAEWLGSSSSGDGAEKGWEDVGVVAERSVTRNAKNRNETISVQESFADISLELKNNVVPNIKEILTRIDEGIVSPLNAINSRDYVDVDDSLTRLKQALEIKAPTLLEDVDDSIERLNTLSTHLDEVLTQMLKIESYNEALQLLRDIIQNQEELRKKTEAERKRKAIQKLQKK